MEHLQKLLNEIEYLIKDANISEKNKEYINKLRIIIESSVSFEDIKLAFSESHNVKETMDKIDKLINCFENNKKDILAELNQYKKDNGSIKLDFINRNLDSLYKLKDSYNDVILSFINEKLNNFLELRSVLLNNCYNELGIYKNLLFYFNNELVIKQGDDIKINIAIVKKISEIISNIEQFSRLCKSVDLAVEISIKKDKIDKLKLILDNYDMITKRELLQSRIDDIELRINNLSLDYYFDINEASAKLDRYESSVLYKLFFENKIKELKANIRKYHKRKEICDKLFNIKVAYELKKSDIETYLKKQGLNLEWLTELENKDIAKMKLDKLLSENEILNTNLNNEYSLMDDFYKSLFDNDFVTMRNIVYRLYNDEDTYIAFLILEALISIDEIISNNLVNKLPEETIKKYVTEFCNNQQSELKKLEEDKRKVFS